jgi:hypothetical protein
VGFILSFLSFINLFQKIYRSSLSIGAGPNLAQLGRVTPIDRTRPVLAPSHAPPSSVLLLTLQSWPLPWRRRAAAFPRPLLTCSGASEMGFWSSSSLSTTSSSLIWFFWPRSLAYDPANPSGCWPLLAPPPASPGALAYRPRPSRPLLHVLRALDVLSTASTSTLCPSSTLPVVRWWWWCSGGVVGGAVLLVWWCRCAGLLFTLDAGRTVLSTQPRRRFLRLLHCELLLSVTLLQWLWFGGYGLVCGCLVAVLIYSC